MLGLSVLRRFAVKHPKTDKEILDSFASAPLAVGWFSASWCGPCKAVQKSIEQMAEEYKDKGVSVVKVDVDDHQSVAADHDVTSVPTFFFFKDGKQVDKVIGASAERVKAAIEKNVKK
jgi:thioredoxin 1